MNKFRRCLDEISAVTSSF